MFACRTRVWCGVVSVCCMRFAANVEQRFKRALCRPVQPFDGVNSVEALKHGA